MERNDPCPCGSGKKFKACHLSDVPGLKKILVNRTADAVLVQKEKTKAFILAVRHAENTSSRQYRLWLQLGLTAYLMPPDLAALVAPHLGKFLIERNSKSASYLQSTEINILDDGTIIHTEGEATTAIGNINDDPPRVHMKCNINMVEAEMFARIGGGKDRAIEAVVASYGERRKK